MIESILEFSIKQRWLVLMTLLGVALLGMYSFTKLPIDAVPDITNVQVQINTKASGYTPLEVEQRITYPIEAAMSGLPKLEYTRSLSRYGLSQVTLVFKDKTNIYFARQLIAERLQTIKSKLPNGTEPLMGPISTGLGDIYMYKIVSDSAEQYSLLTLRTIQDWFIKPQLRNISGVAEINAIGGFTKQYQVSPNLKRLIQLGLTLENIEQALRDNNDNIGAGYIEKYGQQFLMRAPGQLQSIDDIEQVVVKTKDGHPIQIKDVAQVSIGHELRQGAGLADGKETVIGTVSMLMGENSRIVSQNIHKKLQEINQRLPKGVQAISVYNRTNLVNATINTVKQNLFEGAFLVIIVLFLFLSNVRAALITAMVIPLVMLMTITGMVENKISANLMSLGALDFGLIVDGAVIIVENCIKNFASQQRRLGRRLALNERLTVTLLSTKEVIKPSLYGVFIITLVYLPILTLCGVEGKMFKPMAQTVILALLFSMILSLTFIPAAIAAFMSGKVTEKESAIMRVFKKGYTPLLILCFRHRILVMALCLLLVLGSGLLAMTMGGEFIPSLDEGDIALHALRIPSTSLTQSINMQKRIEQRVKKFTEVAYVFSKIGTAEIATDPMPPNVADTFIILKPRDNWANPARSKSDLIVSLQKELAKELGNNYEFTQPIQMRFNELISGVRSDVAVKIYGDDLAQLLKSAKEVFRLVNETEGAEDARIEQVLGLPTITISIDRKKLARYGLKMATVQKAIKASLRGNITGLVYEGDQRFDLVIRLDESQRKDSTILNKIYIELPPKSDGIQHFVPLSEVASFNEKLGPNQISRENGKRRIFVTSNVRDRDLNSFVQEIQKKISQKVSLPSGYWVSYGGQFEQLESAISRLMIIIPVTLLLILIVLYAALQSKNDTLLVFSGIPLALTGGVLALWLRGIPLSISAGVGFIALSGIAILNSLLMVTFISSLKKASNGLVYATIKGALARLRPVLMTAFVASLGFVPMALSTGVGAEVQRPLATVVIGGILSSTFLTLLVLPGLYYWTHKRPKSIS